MKQTFFLVTEMDESVVGVIGAVNNDELKSKMKSALIDHFDSEIKDIPTLDMEDYIYGRVGEIHVTMDKNELRTICGLYIQSVTLY